jgi:tRNA uracil 4-sulfurtransferase
MKSDKCFLIHYGELSLKGKNRSVFELKLKENIENATGGRVSRYRGYFILEGGTPEVLSRVMGISWYAEAHVLDNGIDRLVSKVSEEVGGRIADGTETFGVFVKRPNKAFPHTSVETAAILGKEICKEYGLRADLRSPDIGVFIEIADRTYIFFQKTEGLRGFPVDVSGRVLSLISGGIDSPVSTYLMMKRGCHTDLIHFHVYSDNGNVESSKMYSIFREISGYQRETHVFLVPYYPFESGILKLAGTEGYELVLFRRFMVMVAERIALKYGHKALVTGDSLGQVASQTIDNLALVKQSVSVPIFQPLITYDKQEIVDYAKKIGTYELSIAPYKDCCSIVSANPKTRAGRERLIYFEKSLDMEKIIESTLDLVSVYVL